MSELPYILASVGLVVMVCCLLVIPPWRNAFPEERRAALIGSGIAIAVSIVLSVFGLYAWVAVGAVVALALVIVGALFFGR